MVSDDATGGETIHVIAAARDSGARRSAMTAAVIVTTANRGGEGAIEMTAAFERKVAMRP